MNDVSRIKVREIAATTYDTEKRNLFFNFVVPNCTLKKLRLIGPTFTSGTIDLGFEEFCWHSNHHFARMGFWIGADGITGDLPLVTSAQTSADAEIGSLSIHTTFNRLLYVRVHIDNHPSSKSPIDTIMLEVTTMSRSNPPPFLQTVQVAGQNWRHRNMPDDVWGNNMILNSDDCLVFKYQWEG